MEAVIVKYRNFDLEGFGYRNAGTTERFSVRVMHSPVGEQHQTDAETRVLPSDLRRQLRSLDKRGLTFAETVELGKVLADLLFPTSVRGFLDRSRERLANDEGLRVRLKLDQYALVDLPWEYAYLPSPGTPAKYQGADGFLVLDRSISLVRYEILGQAPGVLDPVSGEALRLVALSASPKELGLATLNLATEQQNIEQALKGLSGIQAEFYPDATVGVLLDAVGHNLHIFHFAGHGKFEGDLGAAYGTIEGQGYLLLTNDAGQPARLSGEKLALNLKGRGIRLAILGACEGGRRDEINPWTGVAPALTKAGIPAVVGMQYTIRDANAIAFSRQFYRALAAGQPVDAAVTEGRLAIFNQADDSERDWGVPVLYLRAEEEEGVLFPQAGAVTATPRVVSTDPPNGAANISRHLTAIKITFDRDMQPDGHGILSGPQGDFGMANARVAYDPATRTFTITRDNAAQPLPPNTGIYFTLNTPAHSGYFSDLAGNRAELTTFGFTTAAGVTVATAQPQAQVADAAVDKRTLREAMIQAFSIEELQVLCSDIQVDLAAVGISLPVNLELVGGSSKSAQVLNLIQYLDRRGYLSYLVKGVRAARPGII
jgi:hypothetical protein